MQFRNKTQRLDAAQPADILAAAGTLRDLGTVAFPTETVYGLGANALSDEAVAKIFAAKQRPHWDPLIVHISDESMLLQVAADVSPLAQKLMDAFWPGPLTLLLPRTAAVPDAVTAGRPLVAVRMPAHPVALALIRAAAVPIAAPSANTFGHTSPTTAAHVLADLDGRIDAILDGGPTSIGLESTVVEVLGETVMLYRPGGVTQAMLEGVAGPGMVQRYTPPAASRQPESLPSPGVGIRHYAPRAELQLVSAADTRDELLRQIERHQQDDRSFGVMLPTGWPCGGATHTFPWGAWEQPEILAQRVFAGLRALDDLALDVILCPVPPADGIGAAILDRLTKAARPKQDL